ncbi:30S ribosomal protein S3 [Candidatus Berkelbacteria bacterium]|nr:30S ribosomal protein S3 [Candidatus Berkelbacteria bacterium]
MSHKTHPLANRLPLTREWRSKWFATHLAPYNIIEDAFIRRLITTTYRKDAAIERVEIERNAQEVKVIIHTAKPGIVIGRGGAGVQGLRTTLERKLQSFRDRNLSNYVRVASERKKDLPTGLKLEIIEIKAPELYAALVAQTIAHQIENRMPYRRVVRQAIERTIQRNAQGIRIAVAGRLNGADIARREKFSEGTVPLSTFRNDIDYAHFDAKTSSYGTIGVKVWIYRGDRLADVLKPQGRRQV